MGGSMLYLCSYQMSAGTLWRWAKVVWVMPGCGILTTDQSGGIPWEKQLFIFPLLIPRSFSKWSQYVSALCFVLFLGSSHYDVLLPFLPVLLTVGQHVAIGTAIDEFHVCFLILLRIFPFCGTSLATFLPKLFLFFILLYGTYQKFVTRSRFWNGG